MSGSKMIEQKIKDRNFSLAVIGLGYVGLPLLIQAASSGFEVTGIDLDKTKIKNLKKGSSYIESVSDRQLKDNMHNMRFSDNYDPIAHVDAIFICVPTPLDNYNRPDLSSINAVVDNLTKICLNEKIIVLESTTYPGHTREIGKVLAASQLKNCTMWVGFSPEREDPGNKEFNTSTIPKLVSGLCTDGGNLIELLYKQFIKKVVRVKSTEVAEIAKLYENIFRSVNIGLVNELKIICDNINLDVYDVIDAAATKPFGFMPFYPGPGLGGHCIPIDPFYLSHKCAEFDYNPKFIEISGEINREMPDFVVRKVYHVLNSLGLSISRSKILLVGYAYKPNINDARETPSKPILEKLTSLGASVTVVDPYLEKFGSIVSKDESVRFINNFDNLPEDDYDIAIISTWHDCFDGEALRVVSRTILDTRGIYRDIDNERIYRG